MKKIYMMICLTFFVSLDLAAFPLLQAGKGSETFRQNALTGLTAMHGNVYNLYTADLDDLDEIKRGRIRDVTKLFTIDSNGFVLVGKEMPDFSPYSPSTGDLVVTGSIFNESLNRSLTELSITNEKLVQKMKGLETKISELEGIIKNLRK
ncbi:MAG: hypothetical protein AAB309_03450 [Deltaproteobacteria bacterium]